MRRGEGGGAEGRETESSGVHTLCTRCAPECGSKHDAPCLLQSLPTIFFEPSLLTESELIH